MGNIFKDFFDSLSLDKNIKESGDKTKEKMIKQNHLYFLEKNNINLPNDIDINSSIDIQKKSDILSKILSGILFLDMYYVFFSPFASISTLNWHYINLIIGFFLIYGSIGYFFVQLYNFMRVSIFRNYMIKEHRKKVASIKGMSYEDYYYDFVKNNENKTSEKI